MGSMPELILNWKGKPYRCRTSMDVIMHIEDKVTLSELAFRAANGAQKGNVPMSHITWVMYCLLVGAGAAVTLDRLWQSIKENETDIEDLTKVISFVIAEVYGVGPEDPDTLDMVEGEKKQESNREG